MINEQERALIGTVRAYANDDPELRAAEDHATGSLQLEVALAGGRRVVDFGEIALHEVSALDGPQRAAAVAKLFARSARWPAGRADVRCLRNVVEMPSMNEICEIAIFVGNAPVSDGVRITTPLRANALS